MTTTKVIHGQYQVQLARSINGGGDAPWELTIADPQSGLYVIQMRFSDQAYAHLHANFLIEISGTLFHSDAHGLVCQAQTLLVPLDDIEHGDIDAVRQRARHMLSTVPDPRCPWPEPATYEQRGWALDSALERWNGHCVSSGTYRVSVRRYVEPAVAREEDAAMATTRWRRRASEPKPKKPKRSRGARRV